MDESFSRISLPGAITMGVCFVFGRLRRARSLERNDIEEVKMDKVERSGEPGKEEKKSLYSRSSADGVLLAELLQLISDKCQRWASSLSLVGEVTI